MRACIDSWLETRVVEVIEVIVNLLSVLVRMETGTPLLDGGAYSH